MVAEVIKSNPFGLDSIPTYLLYLSTEINQLYLIHASTKFLLLTWWQLRNKLTPRPLLRNRAKYFQNHSDTECAMPTG